MSTLPDVKDFEMVRRRFINPPPSAVPQDVAMKIVARIAEAGSK